MDADPEPEQRLLDVPGHPGAVVRVEVVNPRAPATALFASGLGLPLELWHPVASLLPGVRCVLFDRPGTGGSGPWPTAATFADQVRLLGTVLEATAAGGEGGGRVVVVGHSHGGLFAEGLARSRPDVVRGLVLVDASDPGHEATRHQLEGRPAALARRLAALPGVARGTRRLTGRLLVTGGTATGAPRAARRAVTRAYGSPVQLRAAVDELAAVRADALALESLAARRPLPDVPVRLVVATRAAGPLSVRRTGWLRRMDHRVAQLGPRVVRIDVEAAHLVMLDAPRAVARAVEETLSPDA
ncbi:alpha/beta fold hydrolase [Phycicoccus duodecadis]|uniref:Pimeloyl-ACP methyl ester carboxylesterase n=1 Tax=Phycicoccus duodecadis TaxID=173053 RepID=A0A2N3YJG9_9MICO|nr:alpha/beta hydrolase [Phycicoccus duodecadis]PKW26996.1 pimeloyl-ACP methyl ester carboxylesterase [Phycicoccus duodecadis]